MDLSSDNKKGRRKTNRGRLPSGEPNPIDIYVGGRVRLARTLRGLSQDELARAVGLTFQQIQKYEKGFNRISASRIVVLAQALDLPVSFFFDFLDQEMVAWGQPSTEVELEPVGLVEGPGAREMTDMMRAYRSINDPDIRRKVYELTKSLAH